MNILSESVLSNIQQHCFNCQKIDAEFKQMKRKLALSYSSIIWLENLSEIYQQLQGIQAVASEKNINLEGLVAGLTYSLDKIFSSNTKDIVEKGKRVVSLVFEMFNKIETNASMERQKSVKKEELPQRSEREEEERTQKKGDIGKKESKRPPVKEEQERATQKLLQNRFQNGLKRQVQKKQPQKEQFSILQSSLNEQTEYSKNSKDYNFDDICLPLIWEESSAFEINKKTITKLNNNDYLKLSTEMPLPRRGTHKLKFEMINAGTVAFGVSPQLLRYGRFFEDKKSIKYLSFQNGGGLVKQCGKEIVNGKKICIDEGQVLEIVYKAEERELIFRNPKLGQLVVQLSKEPIFKNKEVYFFLQMKQENTKIRIL